MNVLFLRIKLIKIKIKMGAPCVAEEFFRGKKTRVRIYAVKKKEVSRMSHLNFENNLKFIKKLLK